jgi:hypothetical protein
LAALLPELDHPSKILFSPEANREVENFASARVARTLLSACQYPQCSGRVAHPFLYASLNHTQKRVPHFSRSVREVG